MAKKEDTTFLVSLLMVKIDGTTYLGQYHHWDRTVNLDEDKSISLYQPVIFEMISVPVQGHLAGQQGFATMMQANPIHTEQLRIQLSFNYAYAVFHLEDKDNPIVKLYLTNLSRLKEQGKGTH